MQDSILNIGYEFEAIGTQWYIGTAEPLPASVKQRLHQRIAIFDKTYSRFLGNSLITTIATATQGGTFPFPEDALPLFELYDILYKVTQGKVEPLIGSELELLGYDANYSLQADPQAGYFNADKLLPDWQKDVFRQGNCLTTQRPITIDVGAAGKGYLVDILSEILFDESIAEFVIDGGGDIRHKGDTEFIIGLEHPENREMVIGTVPLKNSAICASATNRRKWGKDLHHILNGRTGEPVQDVVATWVIAENALTADGLATALFFVDAEKLQPFFDFSFVRVFYDMRIDVSENFRGTLFTK
jgi:Membrane-associated lipoprotein involved in thiamine biosynthesis